MSTITIAAIGMVTALGPDAANSCAAARASLSRLAVLEWLEAGVDEVWGGQPIVGHSVWCNKGTTGVGKILALGCLALRDLFSNANLSERQLARTGILINLPDRSLEDASTESRKRAGDLPEDTRYPSDCWKEATSNLLLPLATFCGCGAFGSVQKYHYGGHAGFVEALIEAIGYLEAGVLDRCIVGGIDSLIDTPVLFAARDQKVLKSGDSPNGFLPGEAAAFLLLERIAAGSTRHPVAVLREAAIEETSHADIPAHGATLARAIGDTLANCGDVCPMWVGDLNGLDSRAIEWGHALVYLAKRFPISVNRAPWLPAQFFGEVGSASGPVSLCTAFCAMERGYAGATSAVVWLSSETGKKAAIRIEMGN